MLHAARIEFSIFDGIWVLDISIYWYVYKLYGGSIMPMGAIGSKTIGLEGYDWNIVGVIN